MCTYIISANFNCSSALASPFIPWTVARFYWKPFTLTETWTQKMSLALDFRFKSWPPSFLVLKLLDFVASKTKTSWMELEMQAALHAWNISRQKLPSMATKQPRNCLSNWKCRGSIAASRWLGYGAGCHQEKGYVLLRRPINFEKAKKHCEAAGASGNSTRPFTQSKGRKFEKARSSEKTKSTSKCAVLKKSFFDCSVIRKADEKVLSNEITGTMKVVSTLRGAQWWRSLGSKADRIPVSSRAAGLSSKE